jgi:hypothetical protein
LTYDWELVANEYLLQKLPGTPAVMQTLWYMLEIINVTSKSPNVFSELVLPTTAARCVNINVRRDI